MTDAPQGKRLDAVLRQRRMLLRFIVRRCGSWSEAEDIYSDLLLLAMRLELPDDPEQLTRWLLRRAVGLCSDRERSRRRAIARIGRIRSLDEPLPGAFDGGKVLADVVGGGGPEVPELLAGRQLSAAVLAALATLDPAERRLLLAAIETPVQVLAAQEGITRHQLRGRLRRARRALFAALAPDDAAELRRLLGGAAPRVAPEKPRAVAP